MIWGNETNHHMSLYCIRVYIYMRLFLFFQIVNPTDIIVLNAIDISIDKAIIECDTTKSCTATDITFSAEQETATLRFDAALQPGAALLHMEFTGTLNDKMKGFYRSEYMAPCGLKRYAGVTQFEATDARRCFPCWDEPAIKATFDITLNVPSDRIAMSNMPTIKLVTHDSHSTYTFDTTPKMSTYLVAVVVGEFDYVEGVSADGVNVRVYTPLGKKEQGLFALDVAVKVLPYYKEYFNIAYPLPKVDLIAIADFSAGAMENWGLITYRETFLLVDPENTSLIRKQSIALTVAHEIAHQWFGNLVTMEWWTHLWLNEGYATFVEFLCVHHLFPEYDIWTQFVTDMHTRALELDCLKNSHPIEVPVGHPSEIDEIFDEISYNKGASVIRMLYHYIGDADFRKGMHIYLTRHQYGNTLTEDLWKALGEASSKPVPAVMSTWTEQKGFPVINVSSQRNGNRCTLTINQAKFTADGLASEVDYFWMIPITVSTSKAPTKITTTTVVNKTSMEIELDDIAPNEWIKVNPGTVGYYRTRYTSDMLQQFRSAITDQSLPPLDRLGLLDDLFALVQAGQTSTIEVMKLIESYRNETNYTVWTSITNSLSKLQILLSHTNLEEKFNRFGIQLYKPVAERLGWDPKADESHLDTLLRSLVLNRLVSFSCPDTLAEATKRFDLHASGECLLSADIRTACYKAVLQTADIETYEKMLKLYRATDLHEEKDRISRALGSIRNVDILRMVVDFAMSVSFDYLVEKQCIIACFLVGISYV